MALALSLLTEAYEVNFGAGTHTSASFTPTANSLLVVCIDGLGVAGNPAPVFSVSGGSLSWTRQVYKEDGGGFYPSVAEVWTAQVGGSPSSMTVAVSVNSGTVWPFSGIGGVFVAEVTGGHNTGSPIGLTGSNGSISNPDPDFSLGGTAAGGSIVIGFLTAGGDDTVGESNCTPGTGWTSIAQHNTGTSGAAGSSAHDWHRTQFMYKNGAVSTADFTLSFSSGIGFADAAIEVKPASGVQFDAKSTTTGANTVLNWTHTPVGTPSAVAVSIWGYTGTSGVTFSATYGGVAMTIAVQREDPFQDHCVIFELANPPAGPQTVVVNSSSTIFGICFGVSVTGSDTSTSFSGTASDIGSGSSTLSATVTGGGSSDLVFFVGGADGSSTVLSSGGSGGGSNTTDLYTNLGFGGEQVGSSLAPGGSSVTGTYTTSGTINGWAIAGASFKATTSGTNITPTQGNLVISGTAPTVALTANRNITPPQGNLVLSGTAPSIGKSIPQGNLVIDSQAPSVQITPTVAVDVPVPLLYPPIRFFLTGPPNRYLFNPSNIFTTVNLTIPQGNVALSSVGPVVGYNIIVPQGNLALSSVAPVIVRSIPQGNLALSSVAPSLDTGLKPLQGNLVLSGTAPVIDRGFTPAQGNLVLSPTAPTVSIDPVGGAISRTPPAGDLTLSSVAPNVVQSIPQGNLTLSPTAPSSVVDTRRLPITGDLTLSSTAPTLIFGTVRQPPSGNLALSSVKPDVVQSITAGQLVLSPTAPTSAVGVNRLPPQGNLTLSTVAPNVVQSITAGQLVLSTTAPSIGISIPQGNLALSSVQPLASVGVTRQPPAYDFSLSSVAPNVVQSITAGQLVLSTTAPSIGISVPQGNLALSSVKPNVVQSISQGNLTLSPTAPTVSQTLNVSITVPQGNLALSTFAPQVGGAISRNPPQGNLVLSGTAPVVTRIFVIAPPTRDLVISGTAPNAFATDPHPITVPGTNLLLSTLPAQLVPGTYVYPPQGNVVLSVASPSVVPGRTHHWLRNANLQGTVTPQTALQGSVKVNAALDGSVDRNTDLEAD